MTRYNCVEMLAARIARPERWQAPHRPFCRWELNCERCDGVRLFWWFMATQGGLDGLEE